jgi:hypothetical protein
MTKKNSSFTFASFFVAIHGGFPISSIKVLPSSTNIKNIFTLHAFV